MSSAIQNLDSSHNSYTKTIILVLLQQPCGKYDNSDEMKRFQSLR